MVHHKYLFIPIDVRIGFTLPTALRSQTIHPSQGIGWHSANHHRRALLLWCVVSLHYPFLLTSQLMDIQMKTALTHHCCSLLEALPSVLAMCWQKCGEVTRTLWSRYASVSCVWVCTLLQYKMGKSHTRSLIKVGQCLSPHQYVACRVWQPVKLPGSEKLPVQRNAGYAPKDCIAFLMHPKSGRKKTWFWLFTLHISLWTLFYFLKRNKNNFCQWEERLLWVWRNSNCLT